MAKYAFLTNAFAFNQLGRNRGNAVLCAVLLLGLLASGALVDAQSTARFQAGRSLTDNTGKGVYYNASYETSISTQYIDTWNYRNGITYFWGSTAPDFTYTLGEGSTDKFRTLIRFTQLHQFLPSNASILSAELTVTFFNWATPVLVQACFMTKPWDYNKVGPSYAGTGWRFSRWNGTASLPWSQPGAWADCSPDVTISLVVPSNEYYGYVSVTLALDPAKVAAWRANNGAQNYGLLLRAVNGTLTFITGQWRGDNPALRRPSLSVTYALPPARPPNTTYPATLGAVSRVWWVDPGGSDEANSGHVDSPLRSPAKAVFEAWPGDQIFLKSGVYPGGIDITRPRITLRSAPGHWATLSLPLNDPQSAVNVITLRPGADWGVISELEVVGGFYYGLMFFTSWENYGPMADRVAKGSAPSHWLLQNVRIHDTGSSAIKLAMKATNVTFSNCEICNTGARLRTAGHGIVALQAYDLAVRDCYLHDIPGAAVHLTGGTARVTIERNYVARTWFGFNLGFTLEYEYMDPINNPGLHQAINVTARNNIITAVGMAGIAVWAGRNTVVAHNTLWGAQEHGQASVLIAPDTHADAPSADPDGAPPRLSRCANLTLWANLLVRAATARAGPVLQIREGGLDPATPLVAAHNVYYDQKGLGVLPFQWGKGAMLEDERTNTTFVGNATGWATHLAVDLHQTHSDNNSVEADPLLTGAFSPRPCSPAKGRAARVPLPPPWGAALVSDDFSGRPRPAGQPLDAGAVQANANGTAKPIPPVPAAFAGKASYTGVGLSPVYDKNWPYSYWSTRACKDLLVDAVSGSDAQSSNYESNYAPFKTIAKALASMNQCDRILLKGGQNHTGGFGIFTPNVTLTTAPTDLAAGRRATVVCGSSVGTTTPCIRTGDGLYGGAAAITLSNFDVAMAGGASAGSCIHLNEGAGSGTSAYWAFYLAARGRPTTLSYIQNMSLINCGLHGIKLSTFVRGVVIQFVNISRPGGSGIEVRGGGDLLLRANLITDTTDTAIRLGGGARNVVVEGNLIKNFGGRGILLGSDSTEVMYTDVDWARTHDNDWHDNVNTLVRNNILDGGAGAGVAFYSARDATVVHNTFLNVAAAMQAGVLLSVSPKRIGPGVEVGLPNTNITFRNNIVSLGGPVTSRLVIESRILQATIVNQQLTLNLPNGTCNARRSSRARRLLARAAWEPESTGVGLTSAAGRLTDDHHHHDHHQQQHPDKGTEFARTQGDSAGATRRLEAAAAGKGGGGGGSGLSVVPQSRRRLVSSFASAAVDAPGELGRNPDGSCPTFPLDNAWHLDVSSAPVSALSGAIKRNIGGGGGNLHADFGGGFSRDGQRILYGIPYMVVDSSQGTPLVPIDIGPAGYPDESDTSPAGFPFPPTAPVEGAYLNCPDSRCPGDRHVLVLDNATCLLYESYRSLPPGVTGSGRWQADVVARFNLSRNALGRPLGWTSADAAGLPIYPGLVKWEEVVVRGVIDHAIRFTGPNSRPAYSPPATHFAPAGDAGPESPWMGMRVRLNASYDCGPLAPAARVFCTALKKYGGIFADNGSPWFFTGEATAKWDSALSQLYDISKIPASAMEVLDTGCLCTNAECTIAECGGVPDVDPNAVPVYPAIASVASLSFANNIYFKAGSPPPTTTTASLSGRYTDRRTPGYDGGLAGWQAYTGGEAGSLEGDPLLDPATYKPRQGSPASKAAPRLEAADTDFYGTSRGAVGGLTDVGAAMGP